MADHSKYLADNSAEFKERPGFPYIRIHPALLTTASDGQVSWAEEHLLLAMHCRSNRLLIVSNKRILIFKIPGKKSFFQIFGTFVIRVIMRFIPGFSELLEVGDKLSEGYERFTLFSGWITRKKKKQREEDAVRMAEGMPVSQDMEEVVWNLRKADILGLVLSYRDQILLHNGFEWKVPFKVSLDGADHKPMAISVEPKGIRITAGGKKAFALYAGKGWEPLKIVAVLVEKNRPALTAAGWSVELGDQKFIFRNSK